MPFSASTFQSTGDPITDLTEDLAAEQKARLTYDNILRLADDPDVRDPIKFLENGKLSTFKDSAKDLEWFRTDLTLKTSMHSTLASINKQKTSDAYQRFFT